MNVAILMPTLPNRTELRERAVASLYKQVYPADWTVTVHQDINPLPTLGAKLNGMIAACTEEYIVLCDDDDWHSPARVQRQVEPLLNGYEMTGTSQIYYIDQRTKQGFLYKGNPKTTRQLWLGGMAFTRALWKRQPFEDWTKGVDTRWQRSLKPKSLDLADPALFICNIHGSNASPKNTGGWQKADYQMLEGMINAS